jgi:hypothetical protein
MSRYPDTLIVMRFLFCPSRLDSSSVVRFSYVACRISPGQVHPSCVVTRDCHGLLYRPRNDIEYPKSSIRIYNFWWLRSFVAKKLSNLRNLCLKTNKKCQKLLKSYKKCQKDSKNYKTRGQNTGYRRHHGRTTAHSTLLGTSSAMESSIKNRVSSITIVICR